MRSRSNLHSPSESGVASGRAGALVALLFAALTACGDDDATGNPEPSGSGTFTTSATASSTTTGAGGGGVGGSGAGGSGAGVGGGGGAGGDCLADSGCYECEPTTTDQFLDACTDSACSPFDNVARLPLYNNGNLPPVP